MQKVLDRLGKRLKKFGLYNISVSEDQGSVRLEGMTGSFEDYVKAGYAAARFSSREVINNLKVSGQKAEENRKPDITDSLLEGRYFDAVVIGGGIIGAATARELTRWKISVALLEKEPDLGCHASGRNDGMVHPGFAAHPGSKKAAYNIRGNRLYGRLSEELGLPFRRSGSILLLKGPFYIFLVPFFALRARKNGVEGCRFLNRRKVFRLIPSVTPKQWGGFFFPSTGFLSPFLATVASAENAVENGAEVFLNTRVEGFDLESINGSSRMISAVRTNRGTLKAGVVINAAGTWADTIAGYGEDRFFSLHFRKGVDCILDKKTGVYQSCASGMPELSQLKSHSKGGGVVPTCEGNLLIGPTAVEVPFREDYTTSQNDVEELKSRIFLNRSIGTRDVITYFAGVRACTWKEDFIIEPSKRLSNLIHAAGIQSPGFASAPAIAEDVALFAVEALKQKLPVSQNKGFNPCRKAPVNPQELTPEERTRLIKGDPAYGRIICRCEGISEGEVRDALRSPVPPTTVDGIKRRTRTGAGRCHGGFCTPRVLEIMADETGKTMESLSKKGGLSVYFTGETKGDVVYPPRKGAGR